MNAWDRTCNEDGWFNKLILSHTQNSHTHYTHTLLTLSLYILVYLFISLLSFYIYLSLKVHFYVNYNDKVYYEL